ncbi:MAG: sigma-70 family RNA polymerase sigma factor [Limisphaerales bacterium]
MLSTDQNDWSLLREYVERGSEAAFETLVRRHLDMVYSAAWRQTGDADLAQEAAQAAFVLLARKAPRLSSGVVIGGWLYRTACLTARRALRDQTHRRIKEKEAAEMRLTDSNDEAWARLVPHLDAALADLGEADRTAIVLRFLERRSFRDLAATLSVSEDAAKKRVARGLEKLRVVFNRQGVTFGVGTIAAALSARAVEAAPAGLLRASVQAGVSGGTAAGPGVGAVVSGVVRETLISRLKWGGAVAGSVFLLAVIGTLHGTRPGSAVREETRGSASGDGAKAVASRQGRREHAPAPVPHSADGRAMLLRVVADENDQPLAQVAVQAEFIIMPGSVLSTFVTDSGGAARVVLPAGSVDGMSCWVSTPGRVPTTVSWNSRIGMASLPPEYALRLPQGQFVAGTVVDETGQPVVGATVHFQGEGMRGDSRDFADYAGPLSLSQSARMAPPTTDEEGSWSANFISPTAKSLFGYVQHPEYAATQFGHIQPPDPIQPSTNIVLVLQRGCSVAGTVRDAAGAPVPEAHVNLQSQLGLPARWMKTDAAGQFEFQRVGSGPWFLMTAAKGFQPGDQLSIQGAEATNLDIVLKALRVAGSSVIRGRVVGEDRKPIGRVGVRLAPGRPGLEEVNWTTDTDAEGRFAWTSAPDHPVALVVAGPSWDWEEQQVELAPAGPEAVITLKPKAKILVHGTVTDRSTGRLLPEFKVLWARGIKSGYVVNTEVLIEGQDGRFAVNLLPEQVPSYGPPGSSTRLDFQAPGYVNKVVRLNSGTNDIPLDIALEPATDIIGTVLCPDGGPAAGARVLFRNEHIRFRLGDGLYVSGPASWPFAIETHTGADGAFRIAKADEIQRLEVVHPQGWANVPIDYASTAVIQLQPWGRVSGVARSGQDVLAGVEVRATQSGTEPEQMLFEYAVRTDTEGRFEFSSLPGGRARVFVPPPAEGQGTNRAVQDISVDPRRPITVTLLLQAQ